MDNKMFCSKCGTELEATATFCPRCGERVATQPAPEPTPIQQYNMNIKPKVNIPKVNIASKIDIKKTVLSNIVPVACLVIGLILFIVGLCVSIPSDYISYYGMYEYVGGDAYNYVVEACLRGGHIAGAQISKGIYIAVGLLLVCISALKINIVKPGKETDLGEQ